jgi:hypothetical protein
VNITTSLAVRNSTHRDPAVWPYRGRMGQGKRKRKGNEKGMKEKRKTKVGKKNTGIGES